MKDLAGYVPGVGAGEEDEASGDFDGLTGSVHWDVLPEVLLGFFRHGSNSVSGKR